MSEGRKMSKSRGSVVLPDDIIDRFGADTMRLYLLFLGPYEQGGDWQSTGLQGPRGFLNRLWQSVLDSEEGPPDGEVERELHKTIKQVTEQTPALQFNTAIAAMMGYLNAVRAGGRTPRRSELEPLLLLLAPYAPHIAEELYARMGHADGIFGNAGWPDYDPDKLVGEAVEIAVQVNGRLRGRIEMAPDAAKDAVFEAAQANENVARHLTAGSVRKVIFVPGKLLNLVVG